MANKSPDGSVNHNPTFLCFPKYFIRQIFSIPNYLKIFKLSSGKFETLDV